MQVGTEITVNFGGYDVQAEVLEVYADYAVVRGLNPSMYDSPFRVPLELPELSDDELEAFVDEETNTPKGTSTAPGPAGLVELERRLGAEDGYRLYEEIREEQRRVSGAAETAERLRDAEALLRKLQRFAKSHPENEELRTVYAEIAKHNLGTSYLPGGSGDRYPIPAELAA